jgi:ActR/RegA family two-component response regulator
MTGKASATVLRGRKVLVVEDRYLIADEMRRTVERLGGRVVGPAPTVDRALALVRTSKPDVGLLDVDLGGDEVYAVADALLDAGALIIFATGYARTMMPPRYRDLPRIEKPVTSSALANALTLLGVHA